MHLNLEKRTALTTTLLAVASLLVILAIILPIMHYIQKLNRETYELRSFLEKRYEHTLSLRSSVTKITEVKAAVKDYPSHLFLPGEELRLITLLESTALENGVTQKISAADFNQPNNTARLTVNIDGEYKKLLKYLSTLETLPYFINTEQIYLTTNSEIRDKPGVNLSLELSLYVTK